MGSIQPDSFASSTQKANIWLKDIEKTAHLANRFGAYTALRAVLHSIRDCLPVGEAAKLSAQMPLLIKGIFFDGWKATAKPRRMKREEFLDAIRRQSRGQPQLDPSLALRAVIETLERHLSPGELTTVLAVLPKEVRATLRGMPGRGVLH